MMAEARFLVIWFLIVVTLAKHLNKNPGTASRYIDLASWKLMNIPGRVPVITSGFHVGIAAERMQV